jgi:hypothetical protein
MGLPDLLTAKARPFVWDRTIRSLATRIISLRLLADWVFMVVQGITRLRVIAAK